MSTKTAESIELASIETEACRKIRLVFYTTNQGVIEALRDASKEVVTKTNSYRIGVKERQKAIEAQHGSGASAGRPILPEKFRADGLPGVTLEDLYRGLINAGLRLARLSVEPVRDRHDKKHRVIITLMHSDENPSTDLKVSRKINDLLRRLRGQVSVWVMHGFANPDFQEGSDGQWVRTGRDSLELVAVSRTERGENRKMKLGGTETTLKVEPGWTLVVRNKHLVLEPHRQ